MSPSLLSFSFSYRSDSILYKKRPFVWFLQYKTRVRHYYVLVTEPAKIMIASDHRLIYASDQLGRLVEMTDRQDLQSVDLLNSSNCAAHCHLMVSYHQSSTLYIYYIYIELASTQSPFFQNLSYKCTVSVPVLWRLLDLQYIFSVTY